jgi:hypothetical protein
MAHLESTVTISDALRRLGEGGNERSAGTSAGSAGRAAGPRSAQGSAEPTGRGGPASRLEPPGRDEPRGRGSREPAALGPQWGTVVERLVQKKASLGSALTGSSVLALEEGRLRVVVEMAFQRDLMDHQENRRLIESEASEVFGRPLMVRCLTRAEAPMPEAAPAPQRAGDAPHAAPVAAKPPPAARPGVRRVIDFFGGRVEAIDS